jgi:hypothetical protein
VFGSCPGRLTFFRNAHSKTPSLQPSQGLVEVVGNPSHFNEVNLIGMRITSSAFNVEA